MPSRDVLHFRRGSHVPDYAIDRAMAHATLFGRITSAFHNFARFSAPKVPASTPGDPESIERAAESFRAAIKFRVDAPIANAVRAAEAAGVFVGTFDPGAIPIQGFAYAAKTPMLMLSTKTSWSRRRFSVMHEVGHLVMHRTSSPEDREDHANRFAGAALIPRAAFWREFPRPINRQFDWAALIALKQRWGLSLQAIIHRAYDLGMIDAIQYRTANIHIANYGWKTVEPAELECEEPAVCARFLVDLRKRSAISSLCTSTDLYVEDIELALGVHLDEKVETSSVIQLGSRAPRRNDV